MKTKLSFLALAAIAVAAVFTMGAAAPVYWGNLRYDGNGLHIGQTTAAKVAFYGKTPVVQPSGAAQTALTDSTGGSTTGSTLAATVGVYDLTLPVPANMSTLSTGGVDVASGIVLGHKFKVLSWEFITTLAGTGSGASLVYNLEIGTTDVGTTPSTCTVTLAGTSDIGERTAATAVSGANTGSASDALSLEVAGAGTAFTAGSGYFVIKVQNMDTADAFANTAELANAIRTGISNGKLGLIKGAE